MAIAFVLLGILLLPVQVFAYTSINEEQDVKLTLTYELPENTFSLFRVAEVSKTVKYTLTETFKNYPIVLENLDSEGWRDMAQTILGYVERDDIVPFITGQTDENGKLVFDKLEKGLYLVVGESRRTEEDTEYVIMPFLVSLPTLTDEDEWNYGPIVSPKYSIKKLQDDSVGSEESQDFVTNNSGQAGTSQSDKLPQTGQLWWPVPVLITTGTILFIAGVLQRKRR